MLRVFYTECHKLALYAVYTYTEGHGNLCLLMLVPIAYGKLNTISITTNKRDTQHNNIQHNIKSNVTLSRITLSITTNQT
jgi:hypothetical protein